MHSLWELFKHTKSILAQEFAEQVKAEAKEMINKTKQTKTKKQKKRKEKQIQYKINTCF